MKKNRPVIISQGSLPKIEKIRKLLVEKYPKCFVTEGEKPKPLKVGIGNDIFDALNSSYPDLITRRALKFCLITYTSSHEYNGAMLEDGAMRFGLDGDEVEAVSTEHQEMARNNPRKIKFVTKKVVEPVKQKQDVDNTAKNPLQAELQKIKDEVTNKPQRKVLTLKKKVDKAG